MIEAANQYLNDQSRLTDIRQYLEVLRHTEFEFNEDVTNVSYINNQIDGCVINYCHRKS